MISARMHASALCASTMRYAARTSTAAHVSGEEEALAVGVEATPDVVVASLLN
jgi:hypothetical protein